MKNILILLILPILSFANVNTGETITAKQFNESTFVVGDVRHSILTESQFQTKFGNFWVRMLGKDVSGSDYSTITGKKQFA